MKKLSLLLTLVLVVSLLTACGTTNTSGETTNTEETKAETTVKETKTDEQNVRIAVDKSNLADEESFINSMKEYGAEVNSIEGANGYLLVFSKSEHEKLLEDKHKATVEKFKKYENDESSYIDSVEYDEDFRNLKLFVNKEKYEESGSTTGNVVIASAALSYQMFLEDGQKISVQVIYADTEEVVSTFTLPMDLTMAQ
ncbi:MAG: hypothetical protein ACI4VW_05465 [Acutalibacteraceae bacterium]